MARATSKKAGAAAAIARAEVAPAPLPMQWLNAPQQARSQKTLERLLDAAEQILRDEGSDALTIPAVVEAAESSVGSFYARFPDKRALLETLHERATAQTIATAEAALDPSRWEGATAAEIVRTVVVFSVHGFGSRRSLMHAFWQTFAGDPGFSGRRARAMIAVGEAVARLLLTRRASMRHPDPENAIRMALRVVSATLEQRALFEIGRADAARIEDEALIEELTRMLLGYLEIRK
jgi:AcrR family transcriptional regulator